jgi:hypothetical protein
MGVGPNPAKHFLRSLANMSGGAMELFDSARKSKWERKVTKKKKTKKNRTNSK